MKTVRYLISWVAILLLAASVITELRKPADERTWHGKVALVFPYDFRTPTLARIQRALWNPEESHVLVPTIFGVGWTINVRALLNVLHSTIS